MKNFPAFLNIDQYKILIVGGTHSAIAKIQTLLEFTNNIEIIAKQYDEEMLSIIIDHKLCYHTKAYSKEDIDGYDMVIVAVDDLDLQKDIYQQTRSVRTLCHSVNSVEHCDFIFPSYIHDDNLTIAVVTSDNSSSTAKYLKTFIQNMLPKKIGSFLQEMKEVKSSLPKGKEGMQYLNDKAKDFFDNLAK